MIVGGALYANRWPAAGRRFVSRHVRELRKVPVWFFSSGVGAKGHVTFGGRLEPDAKGIREWASEVTRELPNAVPGRPVDVPAHSVTRLLTHGFAGCALCTLTMLTMLQAPLPVALLWAIIVAVPGTPNSKSM